MPSLSFDEREEKVYNSIKDIYLKTREKKRNEKGEEGEEGEIVIFVKVMNRNLGVGFVAQNFISLISRVLFLFRQPVLIITSAVKLLPIFILEEAKRFLFFFLYFFFFI